MAVLFPSLAMAEVRLAGDEQRLYQEVRPTDQGTTFTFTAGIASDVDAEAYFKVVPASTNPAFGDGSPESGWWTEVTLQMDDEVLATGGSNGSEPLPLPDLQAGPVYGLRLNVTVPPGALAESDTIQLRYLVALRNTGGEGSGGQLDPSVSINPQIVVSEDASQTVPESTTTSSSDPGFPVVLVAGAVALAGLVLLALFVARRRGN